MRALILYMPVLHRGYLELIAEVQPHVIALLTEEVLCCLPDSLTYLAKKDIIRAVPSEGMRLALEALYASKPIKVMNISMEGLLDLANSASGEVVMPDEDVSRVIAEQYFGGVDKVRFVASPAPRLRYHRNNVEEKKLLVPDRRIAISALDRDMMAFATNAAQRSPDWYRQVGFALHVVDGRTVIAYNEHQPHEQIAATFGDPRSLFKSGVRTDLSYGDHAEHVGIGEAARFGIPTDGAHAYCVDFPCLMCARLIVRAGVKKLFYRNPSYGLLDADQYLRLKQVEIIEVSDEN